MLEPKVFTVTRADLVRYAEASGDHNPIHQDEDVARSVGLPGVIAHGMYTMALAARAVGEWFPGAITPGSPTLRATSSSWWIGLWSPLAAA